MAKRSKVATLDLSCSLSARESDFDPQLSVLLDLVVVIIAVLDLESVDQAPQGYLRNHPATQLGSKIASAFQLLDIGLELNRLWG
jgi:hypothetical protein